MADKPLTVRSRAFPRPHEGRKPQEGFEPPPELPIKEGRKGRPDCKGRKPPTDPQNERKRGLERKEAVVRKRTAAEMKGPEGAPEDSAFEPWSVSESEKGQQKPEDDDMEPDDQGASASHEVSQGGNLRMRWETDESL